jgi:acyl carrier protein
MRERIISTIYSAIDRVNETLPQEKRIEKSKQAAIYGPDGKIDSLELTLLVVAMEEHLQSEIGKAISLLNVHALSQDNNPFQRVDSLADHIFDLIEKD